MDNYEYSLALTTEIELNCKIKSKIKNQLTKLLKTLGLIGLF